VCERERARARARERAREVSKIRHELIRRRRISLKRVKHQGFIKHLK
jgi:hypothetical protein